MKHSSRKASTDEPSEGARVRVKMLIAYDGTEYSGWQVQKIGRGVQEVIETSLQKIFGIFLRIHGSSRTDTGVHALGMVAHVDIPKGQLRMPIEKVALAINANLPEDVRIMEARIAAPDFHARFDARGKQYRYYVWNHPAQQPLGDDDGAAFRSAKRVGIHIARRRQTVEIRHACQACPGANLRKNGE